MAVEQKQRDKGVYKDDKDDTCVNTEMYTSVNWSSI